MKMHRWFLRALLLGGLFAVPGQGQSAGPQSPKLDLDLIDRRIDQLRRQEHSLKRALEEDKTALERLRSRIIVRGRAYYRLSRSLPKDGFFEHAVRLERLRQALLRDMREVDELSSHRLKADRGLSLLSRKRAPLEVEVAAAGRARNALLSQTERERAFEMAFQNSRGASDHTAVYSAAAAIELESGADTFEAMRGRLPFPLPGRTEVETVERDYADGPGLLMKTRLGAPARSVFPGRVAFADEYPSYGQTVILDHGDGYFTVTAGLSAVDVRVGDDLPAGSRLGASGSAGGMGQIYFEVRQEAQTLDPSPWFGI